MCWETTLTCTTLQEGVGVLGLVDTPLGKEPRWRLHKQWPCLVATETWGTLLWYDCGLPTPQMRVAG